MLGEGKGGPRKGMGRGVRRGLLTVLCQAFEGPLELQAPSHSTENSKRIQCGHLMWAWQARSKNWAGTGMSQSISP